MGMGHDQRPMEYPGTRRLEIAVPVLKKHIIPFEGHAVRLHRWWGDILVHPLASYPSISKHFGRLREAYFSGLPNVTRNFSMVCANYEPPEHVDYTRLPKEVPLSEIVRIKSEYLNRGLWVNYTPDSIRPTHAEKPGASWLALGRNGFETILSAFLGESVQSLRSRQKIQVRDTIRNSDLLEHLQILCLYYGYHATIEWQPRTVTMKIAPRNVLHLQQRTDRRNIAGWEYLEGQTIVLVSRLRFYLVRIEGEPLFVGLSLENAERGSVRTR